MDNKSKKDLFLKLYNSKSAHELHCIVMKDPILSKQVNWKPYGGNQNNCGTFEGQQAKPEAALVEKITNSIDAILMKECMLKGIDPKDIRNPHLPRTMNEATEKFFGIKNGKWENSSEAQRREIASQLQIVLTDDKQTPNIVIFDNGEGQNPDKFENTFLSLHRGNKMDIPFVQGKFNMGSTGAVRFCGDDEKYQMIVSRRNQNLSDSDSKIGFTLVRKHILTAEEENTLKSTWYEYFTIDDMIPYLEESELDLGLNNTKFVNGTIIKLYSYQLSAGCRSEATLDLWRELNTLLYESSIPILIYETRYKAGHTPTKVMLGNKARITIDDRDKKYASKSFSINDTAFFGAEVPIEVIIFKPDVNNKEFIRRRPVIFLMNGQTQGIENRTFISSELNLRQIRDNILVCIDCTRIKTSVRNDLFMSSRDRLSEGKSYERLKEKLIDILKNDDDLKRINQEFKGMIIRESKDDKELIQNLFSSLKENKEIKNLFAGKEGVFSFFNKKVKNNTEAEKKEEKPKEKSKNLKRFPSTLKVLGLDKIDDTYIKCINKGSKGVIKLETDADNEFLTRNIEKGEFEINFLNFGDLGKGGGGSTPTKESEKIRVSRSGPYDGEIKIILEPNDDVNVGDWFEISMKLISIAGEHEVKVMVKIEKETEKNNKHKKETEKEEPELNLPQAFRVFAIKKNADTYCWAEKNMNAESIVDFDIGDNDLIESIFINMDSNLIKKLINKPGADVKSISDKYFAAIYTHSLMVYSTLIGYFSSPNIDIDENIKNEIKDKLEDAIKFIFKPYSAFLLTFDLGSTTID